MIGRVQIFSPKISTPLDFFFRLCYSKSPFLIAIDQEGGGHMQLIKGVTRIPFAIQLGATRSATLVYKAGEIVGSELKCLGINTVLAPVADVNNNA